MTRLGPRAGPRVGAIDCKAATVKPQERLMLYTLGEHVFEVGADSSEQGPEA